LNRGLGAYNGSDAVVNQLTLAFDGKVLLNETHLIISKGHRYGLIGRNGVGKTTLMRRIASESVPGWPLHLSTAYVQQELLSSSMRVMEEMLSTGTAAEAGSKERLEAEQVELEARLCDESDPGEKAAAADRLSEIYERLDALSSDLSGQRAKDILKGLQFATSMFNLPVDELSGGWRMRLAMAKALFAQPDILLLDEPTNHLDLEAVLYVQEYLVENDLTALIVSHDGSFLDACCTDMIKFDNAKLHYHVGNYTSFRQMEEEAFQRHRNTGDAVARKEKKAKEFIAKQKSMANSKHRDDNKQKQAAERQKKLGRVGLFAENGHRFSLLAEGKTGGAGANRAGHIFGNYTSTNGMQSAFVSNEKVAFGDDKQLLNFKFPAAPPLSGSSGEGWGIPLVTMERAAFGYTPETIILQQMTLGVSTGSRIAIVGKNGSGKSTLVKLLVGDLSIDERTFKSGAGGGKGSAQVGKYTRHQNLRTAYIAQHHVEQLAAFLEVTPVQYFMRHHHVRSEQEARQFLGGFGLVGSLALQLIGTLSGGQKARLVFATVMFTTPHLLVLDEPTNHLDRDSLESLSPAIKSFKGAVVMVSHNQEFMSACATEMWMVNEGKVVVSHVEDGSNSFNANFKVYRSSLQKTKGAASV